MLTRFDRQDLSFTIENLRFHAANIVFEQFKRSIPRHSHSRNSYEIHYIPFGQGHATMNGRRYELVPGTLFVTGPFVEHEQIPFPGDPMSEYCIYLKIEHIPSSGKTGLRHPPAGHPSPAVLFENTSFWFGQDTQDVHSLMKQLFAELEHRSPGYDLLAVSCLQQLIVKMVRNYMGINSLPGSFSGLPGGVLSSGADIRSSGHVLTNNQLLIVEECFLYDYQILTLEKLASRLGLGIRQTERLLKEQYGKTFLRKKTEARMSAASILLQDSNKSITEISNELGYSSIEHFSAAFKRFYGKSASECRKELLHSGQIHSTPHLSRS